MMFSGSKFWDLLFIIRSYNKHCADLYSGVRLFMREMAYDFPFFQDRGLFPLQKNPKNLNLTDKPLKTYYIFKLN